MLRKKGGICYLNADSKAFQTQTMLGTPDSLKAIILAIDLYSLGRQGSFLGVKMNVHVISGEK